MASSVEIDHTARDAFNERYRERMRSLMAETVAYSDRSRGLELGSLEEFLPCLQERATGALDARGERVRLPRGRRVLGLPLHLPRPHEGPSGPGKAVAGKRMDMPVLRDRARAGSEGRQRRDLYDHLTILTVLGLAEAPVPG